MTMTSGSYAESVWTVSRSDSPLSTLEPDARRLTTSAESRLAASSNDELVRVEASKNTVITVRPRRVGTFLRSRCMTDSKPSAVCRMRSTSSRSRSATEIRWRRSCGGFGGESSTTLLFRADEHDAIDLVDLEQLDVHPLAAGGGQVLPDVIGADRELPVAAVDEDGELHPPGAAVVEERLD